MCINCKSNKSHEKAWQEQVIEESNARRILCQLIEKSEALLDFYYHVQINHSKREVKIKFDLIDALADAKKHYSDL